MVGTGLQRNGLPPSQNSAILTDLLLLLLWLFHLYFLPGYWPISVYLKHNWQNVDNSPADFSMKEEILKTAQSFSSVSCRMSRRHFSWSRNPEGPSYLYGSSAVSSLWVIHIQWGSPGKSSFLQKWLGSLFDAHLPFEVAWCNQEQICLTVMKSPNFLKHLIAIFWRSLKELKNI